MADFGIQATQLSAPSGAGTGMVAPVQEQAVGVNIMPLVDAAANLWVDLSKSKAKDAAQERENKIVGLYVQKETEINDAVTHGKMDPSKASALSAASANKFARAYPEYLSKFKTAADDLRGITERGNVEKELDRQADIRKTDIKQAQERGYTFYPGMSKVAEDAQIRSAKTSIMAEKQQSQLFAKNEERRQQGRYDQAVAEREEKNQSMRWISEISNGAMGAFSALASDLGEQTRSGKMTPEAAQALFTEQYTKIQSALQVAAGTNPTLAATFRTLYDDMYKLGMRLTDPKDQAENVAAQMNYRINSVSLAC